MWKWKDYILKFKQEQPPLCRYSRLALAISGYTVYGLIWCMVAVMLYLPYTAHYIEGMAAIRAAWDNVPAVLFAGVIAAAIGDGVYHQSNQ